MSETKLCEDLTNYLEGKYIKDLNIAKLIPITECGYETRNKYNKYIEYCETKLIRIRTITNGTYCSFDSLCGYITNLFILTQEEVKRINSPECIISSEMYKSYFLDLVNFLTDSNKTELINKYIDLINNNLFKLHQR